MIIKYMTDSRRTFRFMSKAVNGLFLFYLICCIAFAVVSYQKLYAEYSILFLKILNIFAYSVYFLSCFMIVFCFQISFSEKKFPIGSFIASLLRGFFTYFIMFAVNTLERIFSEGLYFSI